MEYTLYKLNAFVGEGCKGNPACVVYLQSEMPTEQMQALAAKIALPETAFILNKESGYNLRWFTPDLEMDLCGHATLASAHVAFKYLRASNNPAFVGDMLYFNTREGKIGVKEEGSGRYTLDFPQRKAQPARLPKAIYDSLSIKPQEVYRARDFLLIYNSYKDIEQIRVAERALFDTVNLGEGGVIVSATGYGEYDFVSRFFTPQATILEDPVTGSAHCTLAPYWGERLNSVQMKACQLSERRGVLCCRLEGERVYITGEVVEA